METPSATQDPLVDTESNDDLSSSVFSAREMTPVNSNSWMQMDNMVAYHKFSNRMDQQVQYILKENTLHLPKGIPISDYPKEPNRRQGVSGGTTPSSMPGDTISYTGSP